MDEIEVTFLNIDVEAVREKLSSLGAVHKKTYLSKRKLFDFPGLPLDTQNKWLRLRDEGDRITLTYKERGAADAWIKETEVTVSDFDATEKILKSVGFIEKRYEENKREKWQTDGITFDIDLWPLIPPYIEIEGPMLEKIVKAAADLGFAWETHVQSSPLKVYANYGIDLREYSVMTFDRQEKKA